MGTVSLNINSIMNSLDKDIPRVNDVFNISFKIDEKTMSPVLVFTRKDDTKEVYKYKISSTIDIKDYRWSKMISELTVIVRDIKVDKILKK